MSRNGSGVDRPVQRWHPRSDPWPGVAPDSNRPSCLRMHRGQPFVGHPGDVGDELGGQAVEAFVVVPARDEETDDDCHHDLETEHDERVGQARVAVGPEVQDGTGGREHLAERLHVPDEVVEAGERLGGDGSPR